MTPHLLPLLLVAISSSNLVNGAEPGGSRAQSTHNGLAVEGIARGAAATNATRFMSQPLKSH